MFARALSHCNAAARCPAGAGSHRNSTLRAGLRKSAAVCKSQAQDDIDSLPSYSRDFADAFVARFIRNGQVVGIGTGAWASCCIASIGKKLEEGALQDVTCIPASDVAASEAAFHGVPLTALDNVPKVDIAFDEVSTLDPTLNAMVIGVNASPQQPQIIRALELINAAKQFVAIMESKKNVVQRLNGYLPVVIDGETWEPTAEELDDIFLGDAELWRRPATGTANPRGGDFPFISQDGHNIVDIRFESTFKLYGEETSYKAIQEEIEDVEGVVAHGLVLGRADYVVFADGAVPTVQQLKV